MKGHSGNDRCVETNPATVAIIGMHMAAAPAIVWTVFSMERIVLVADATALRPNIFEGMRGRRSVPTERVRGYPFRPFMLTGSMHSARETRNSSHSISRTLLASRSKSRTQNAQRNANKHPT